MIYGIGCDLCAIPRMEKSLTGPHGGAFARRVFGPNEREALGLSEQAESLPARRTASAAANFAAKEAFLKAAGTGLAGPFALAEIQAVRLPSGPPHRMEQHPCITRGRSGHTSGVHQRAAGRWHAGT